MPSRSRNGPAPRVETSAERIEASVRELVRAVAPELRTERRWGRPWYAGTDLVLRLGEFGRHVGVEFWRGASLADPHHRLEGTGPNLRHVTLRSIREATAPPVLELIREAVDLDRAGPVRTRLGEAAAPMREP